MKFAFIDPETLASESLREENTTLGKPNNERCGCIDYPVSRCVRVLYNDFEHSNYNTPSWWCKPNKYAV